MSGRAAKRPTRTRNTLVRLTQSERERCERLVRLHGGAMSDVLRAGISALEREHEEGKEEAARCPCVLMLGALCPFHARGGSPDEPCAGE